MNPNQLFTGVVAASCMMLFLIAVIIIVILAARRQALMRRLSDSESRHMLAEASFKALRAQMNPHFIFNCLNSIKLYTEQNDSTAASAYLSKFARLVRAILDNSRVDKVPLTNELDSIRLYLDMEAMRFKNKLQYTVVADEEIDADFMEIPPLLIQPYVENAIWHGLMHRQEGGQISVQVTDIKDVGQQVLNICIEDNGIGRGASAALNAHNRSEHKSHGTDVTAERIKLINDGNGRQASVNITDLFHQDGSAAGTRVNITLPV